MPSRTAHEERRPRQRAVYNEHEYASFRSSIPLRKILTSEVSTQPWVSFDAGPKSVRCPLVFLPPVCGGADCFYKQLIALSAKGYRVIALEWPPCWDTAEWCRSLLIVLDVLRARKVHLFGASLGGFLAQKFAETYPTRTASLILCNTFSDTGIFHRHESSFFYRMFPGLLLKKLVLSGLPGKAMERDIAASVDFMVDNVSILLQIDAVGRIWKEC
uniref:Maspardin n=1 Tax=Plectus sambesii TaxID=2011161 RepID=A0A914UNE3_9BILA